MVEDPRRLWTIRPGWGIAANLTPPELVSSYRLRRLQERIVLAVCLVALFAAGGFAYGFWRSHQASNDLQTAQSRATSLQHQIARYGSVTRIQGSVSQVRTQLASLLSDDVDVATLMGRIQAARPGGVAITTLTISLDGAGTSTNSSATSGSLDTSGAEHIGTIEIDGTGRQIDDLPKFVDAVAAIPGFVDVLPTSNATQAVGTKFALTVTLTDKLLTHRFDLSSKGQN